MQARHRRPAAAAGHETAVLIAAMAETRRRTGNRAADPIAGASAGPRAALGAPRGAASHPQARAIAGPAGRGDAGRARADRRPADLRQCRHARSLHRLPGSSGATPDCSSSSNPSPISGRSNGRASLRAPYHVLGGTLSPLDGIGPEDLNLPAPARAGRRGRDQGSDPRRQRHGRRPDHRPLHHRSPQRLSASR